MKALRLADILHLVAVSDDPVAHLGRLFEWQIERAMTVLRVTTTAVGAIFVALIAAVLDNDGIPLWMLVLVGISSTLGLGLAWLRYRRARNLERDYVVALGVLQELVPLSPLLRLWSGSYVD